MPYQHQALTLLIASALTDNGIFIILGNMRVAAPEVFDMNGEAEDNMNIAAIPFASEFSLQPLEWIHVMNPPEVLSCSSSASSSCAEVEYCSWSCDDDEHVHE